MCEKILADPSFHLAEEVEGVHAQTALHLAALNGHIGACRVLLSSPRFLLCNAKDRAGRTALHLAALQGHAGCVKALVEEPRFTEAGAADNCGRTALTMAALGGHAEVARVLIEESDGASLDSIDIYMWSALHMAASQGHAAVARILLAAGPEFGAITAGGKTAFGLAVEGEHDEVIKEFAKHAGSTFRDHLDDQLRETFDRAVETLYAPGGEGAMEAASHFEALVADEA